MIICEALFLIFGLYALLTGRIRISGKRTIVGTRARTIGLLLIAPLIFGFCGGMYVGATQGSAIRDSSLSDLVLLEVVVMSCTLLAALGLSLTAPETPVVGTPSNSFPVYGAPSLSTVMTVQEAADYLRVTPAEVSQLIETGQIIARQIGMEYRISKQSLDNFLTMR